LACVLETVGLRADIPTLNIVLPVGISFYTFQSMAYAIEVYRGRTEPVRDPVLFFLFVSYFPTLVAGPIERPTNLFPQLTQPRRVTPDLFASGCLLILTGLARKVFIADNAAVWVDEAFAAPGEIGSLPLLAAAAMFGIQIYSDFAGYSDMARGTSQLLGVQMIENFRQPYFATSIADFWRRWHMSLSSWLRDYLYIPLGGNRHGRVKTYRNLLLTMLLGGLWHGANWTFVVWGGLHGTALAVQKGWTERRARSGAVCRARSAPRSPGRRRWRWSWPPGCSSGRRVSDRQWTSSAASWPGGTATTRPGCWRCSDSRRRCCSSTFRSISRAPTPRCFAGPGRCAASCTR